MFKTATGKRSLPYAYTLHTLTSHSPYLTSHTHAHTSHHHRHYDGNNKILGRSTYFITLVYLHPIIDCCRTHKVRTIAHIAISTSAMLMRWMNWSHFSVNETFSHGPRSHSFHYDGAITMNLAPQRMSRFGRGVFQREKIVNREWKCHAAASRQNIFRKFTMQKFILGKNIGYIQFYFLIGCGSNNKITMKRNKLNENI